MTYLLLLLLKTLQRKATLKKHNWQSRHVQLANTCTIFMWLWGPLPQKTSPDPSRVKIFVYFSPRSILTLPGTWTMKINRKSLTILKESQTQRSHWSHIILYSPSATLWDQISLTHTMRFISEKTETAVPTKTKIYLYVFFLFLSLPPSSGTVLHNYQLSTFLHSMHTQSQTVPSVYLQIHLNIIIPSCESPTTLRFSANTLHEFISSSSWSLLWASTVSNHTPPPYWSTLVSLYMFTPPFSH